MRPLPEGDFKAATVREWEAWWSGSVARTWTSAQTVAAERHLEAIDDYNRCVDLRERRFMREQLQRERRALGLARPPKPPTKEDRQVQALADTPAPVWAGKIAVIPPSVLAAGEPTTVNYCLDMKARHGPRWNEM